MADTPWFHKVLRAVGMIAAFISMIPQILDKMELTQWVTDGGWMDIITKAVFIAGIVTTAIAQLAVTEEAKKQAAEKGLPIK